MAQPRKNIQEVQEILSQIMFWIGTFAFLKRAMDTSYKGSYYKGFFDREATDRPGKLEEQFCHRWYVPPFSTETKIVGTAWKAILNAESDSGSWKWDPAQTPTVQDYIDKHFPSIKEHLELYQYITEGGPTKLMEIRG